MSDHKNAADAAPRAFDISQAMILGLSVLAGLLAFWLTSRYIRGQLDEVERLRRELYAEAEKVPVVVAYRDLPAGTTLRTEDLARKSVFRGAVTENTVLPEDVAMVMGKRLRFMIRREEPLLWNYVDMPFQPGTGLAPMIRTGLRAISISVNSPSSVSGLVQPNDRVDVLGTFTFPSKAAAGEIETLTLTMLQDVTVLAVGQHLARPQGGRDPRPRPGGYNTVTFEVTPREAEMLVFAQTMRGNLTLTLRNPADVSFERNLPEINFDHIEKSLEELNLYRQRAIRHKDTD